MPVGEGNEVAVVYFKPKAWEYTCPGYISDDDLEKALERRNLKNDPRAVIADNKNGSAFAHKHPNSTHWKDGAGNWCFVTFIFRRGRLSISILSRFGDGWSKSWWFAGVRQGALCIRISS